MRRLLLALLSLPAASSLLLAPRTSYAATRASPHVTRRASPHMASKKSKGKAGKAARASAGGFGAAPPKAQPFDLKRAMLRAMEPYAELRAADRSEARELSLDVYVKATGEPRFWFVGKAVGSGGGASTDCDATNAVLLQKRLVLEHAKRLQRVDRATARAVLVRVQIVLARAQPASDAARRAPVRGSGQGQDLLGPLPHPITTI